MKRIFAVILALLMIASTAVVFSSCGEAEDDFKLGVILLHDEKSTYDLNFINAVEEAAKALGLTEDQVIFKKNIPEDNACYDAAVDLVDQGCDVIFADSFGHETFMLKAAKEYPDVEFCHATGNMAHTEKLDNFQNAFASIYEGRYLAGVAAGLKLKEMMDNATEDKPVVPKIGYVGAFTYAEVISGYTSFYLGVKSIVPEVTMEVQFTGSWYDEIEEKNAANALIENGCVLISQHADSMGAPSACEEKGIPNVSYNGSTVSSCPDTFIVASRINWAPYVQYICEKAMAGEKIDVDWTGTIKTESVLLTEVNGKAAAAGTAEYLETVKGELLAGTRKVFDTDNFTVTVADGKNANATVDENGKLTAYNADVDYDDKFTGDTNVVSDGYFHESEYRSAPYFDVQIDGITLLNAKF